jgi:serine/threonine-protein kinase
MSVPSPPSATPQQGRPTVALRIISGPHQGEEFVFDSHNTLVVGRATDAQWRMTKDPFFSRYHFRVEVNPPACWLVDLGSSNGVRVNGVRVQNIDLKDGDRINCGDTVFEISVRQTADERYASTLDAPPEVRIANAPSEVPEESFPRSLADFELTREIGRGGMGVVYHAIQRSTGRETAVKLIRPAVVGSAESTQLFLREAAILSQLCHPRIVEYLSLGIQEGQMYLAMEYLPTIDFPALLATQSRSKQIRLVCGIMCRVLEALQHAHEQDVVHRDVKPANILIFKRDGRVLVKLGDFGLAKNYLHAGFTAISCENNIRGTLNYIAPEQLINCRYAKPPCDIYGVGVCLYRFLSGRLPIEVDDSTSAMALLLNSRARPLAEHAADIPAQLAAAVDRALAREPGDRFSSAEHMRRALLRFAEKAGAGGEPGVSVP